MSRPRAGRIPAADARALLFASPFGHAFAVVADDGSPALRTVEYDATTLENALRMAAGCPDRHPIVYGRLRRGWRASPLTWTTKAGLR